MERFCPNCSQEGTIDRINSTEALEVRGEKIDVDVEYFKCRSCDFEFENMNSDVKPVEEAYRKYREKHRMVKPEEITAFRKHYGLSQKDLGMILGWGGATLSRYENGALQDEAHDRMLQMALDPINLLSLIEKHPEHLPARTRERLIKRLSSAINTAHRCEDLFNSQEITQKPDIFSGYAKFQFEKLKNAILFLCKGGQLKTVINKLLFYSDFKFFKEQGMSITGSRYAHLNYGPVLDNFQHLLALMVEADRSLDIEERQFDADGIQVGQIYTSVEEPDMSLFSPKEVEIMQFVKDAFKDYGAKRISDFSHEEEGYKKTSDREYISYEYARSLLI